MHTFGSTATEDAAEEQQLGSLGRTEACSEDHGLGAQLTLPCVPPAASLGPCQ